MTRFYGALLGLAITLVAGGRAGAQGAPVAAPHLTAQLVAETAGAAPGSTVWVAVVLSMDKGWHTYWRNPGDAGEATRIAWTLPPGWRAGDIVWPAPERLPVGPIMDYGYEGRVLLATPVQIPVSARAGDAASVGAVVDYLVCAQVCIPGTARLSLNLPMVAGAPPSEPGWGPKIAATLAASPKPGALRATFRKVGGALALSVGGSALAGVRADDAYFYPFDDKLIDHSRIQTVERGPAGLTLMLTPGAAFAGGAGPNAAEGVLRVDGKAFEIDATPGPPLPGASGLGPPAARAVGVSGLPLAMAFGFLGGLILNLMPCVFPILSIKAAALAAHGGEPSQARTQGLAFMGGVIAAFLALAGVLIAARAAGAAVGWGFQLQSPWVVASLGLIMLAAALNLSGLFEIGGSVQTLGAGGPHGGVLGSAFTGLLAVVVAAPCTAPFMASALGYALTQPAVVAMAVFSALAVGFGAPYTALCFSPGLMRRLPRPGAWMNVFRRAVAFPMYAAAAWLAWVLAQQSGPPGLAFLLSAAILLALTAWLFGLAQHRQARGARAAPLLLVSAAGLAGCAVLVAGVGGAAAARPGELAATGPAALPSQPWTPDRLAALRRQGRPVLVNFTAAWCVTCQVNERLAFSTPQVAEAFRRSGAVYLVADWTNRNPAIAKALADQGRIGVPLYLIYGADGGAPSALPQLLTPGIVAQALGRAAVRPAASAAR